MFCFTLFHSKLKAAGLSTSRLPRSIQRELEADKTSRKTKEVCRWERDAFLQVRPRMTADDSQFSQHVQNLQTSETSFARILKSWFW